MRLSSENHTTPLNPEEETSLISREEQVFLFKQLTEKTLPELARHSHWPLRLDHCFKRVCLDYAFSGTWYSHLPKPAERHINGEPLRRAIACAQEIVREGEAALRLRNEESLRYRGKLKKVVRPSERAATTS